jgi:hypothetical protein
MSFAPSLLTDLEADLVIGVVAFVVGVVFSTKVKDTIKGVPAAARVAINNVEADALAKLKSAQTSVLATLPGAAPAPKVAQPPVFQTALPPAPVAPAPAPNPAPAAAVV